MSDCTYYAIGDIHGEVDKLDRLMESIRVDAARLKITHKIVFLGDLVDRGPDSRAVIERVMSTCETGEGIAICGNHEVLMLNAYDNRESVGIYWWAENGGDETIMSYMLANGTQDDFRDAIDKEHIAWLRTLPAMVHDKGRRLVFVHGGIDPKTFPNCSDEVRMWTRSRAFFNSETWPQRDELKDLVVVHGHTPTYDKAPEMQRRRINVDTGACFGGPLTCVALAPGDAPRFLRA